LCGTDQESALLSKHAVGISPAVKTLILPSAMILTLAFGSLSAVYADSATWNLHPTSNDWNTAANWTPATAPNGPSDVATFARSSTKSLEFSAAMTEVAEIVFSPGANSFKISVDPILAQTVVYLTISGAGITNSSGVMQNLVSGPTIGILGTGVIQFFNAATAGDGTVVTALGSSTRGAFSGSEIHFYDSSTAGSATIVAEGARAGDDAGGGSVLFHNNATAANANFTLTNSVFLGGGSGEAIFADSSSASDAIFNVEGGEVFLSGSSEAATAQFTVSGGSVTFDETSSAADAAFTIEGGSVNFFAFDENKPTAANGLFTINGGSVQFFGGTAGNATLTASSNGGDVGRINFNENDESEVRIQLFGEGTLDITSIGVVFVSIGSIEGDGLVLLGNNKLITGSNDLSTTFSGIIQDTGSLDKIGHGALTLAGENTYAGGTTIEGGKLLVANQSGSATGSGPVSVTSGKLGGNGIIAGSTTIGTGSGTRAFLAPGVMNLPSTLTIQSTLTFNADATYTCAFRAKQNRATTGQVIANGVTINSGAMIALSGEIRGTLTQGLALTLISNTSANPISGTFSNLPDGSIVTINGNNFQVSYEGGDGNDLTLTVVP
jgi:autotransporter-associated beta strand protein